MLAVAPYLRHAHELEPPRVLSVLLPVPATVEEPAAPAPAPPRAPAAPASNRPPRARPRAGPRDPAGRGGARAEPSRTGAADAATEGGTARRRAADPAPAAAPSVAAAPREPASPPDFRAAYLRNPAPAYPTAARRNGEEGTVTLRVLVSTEGAPREVMLERSSGSSSLDAAALATVKTWRFTPARRGGEAQEAWVLVPIVFRLEPRG